ncbi:unnamed protein product [Caretta caretta]
MDCSFEIQLVDEGLRPDATDEEIQKNMELTQRKSSYQLKPQGEFQRAGVNATYTWSQKKQKVLITQLSEWERTSTASSNL